MCRYNKMQRQQEVCQLVHDQTLAACDLVEKGDWTGAATLYQQLNETSTKKIVRGTNTSIDICFVMDCTSSMSNLINACQEKVIAIAEKLKHSIGQKGIEANVRMAFIGYRCAVSLHHMMGYVRVCAAVLCTVPLWIWHICLFGLRKVKGCLLNLLSHSCLGRFCYLMTAQGFHQR